MVDSVSEVLNIKADDIEDTPTFGTRLDTAYIFGMAKMEGGRAACKIRSLLKNPRG